MNWIISNVNDKELCWSNDDGWTDTNYDTYSDEEKAETRLPIEGKWEQVAWSIN